MSGDLGVLSVTSWASDGAVVTATWDEIGSESVRWLDAKGERMLLEQETASKVSIRGERGQIEF